MVDTESYKELMDVIEKLLGGMTDEEPEAAPSGKKKGKTVTIISISKAKPGALKIPKMVKGEDDGDE